MRRVASMSELARQHTDLDAAQIAHLHRLVRSWDLLSDLSFADMLLFGRDRTDPSRFVVLDQIRPTTGPTMYRDDRIGQLVAGGVGRGAMLTEAFHTGEVVDGGLLFRDEAPRIRAIDIPVRADGQLLAVLSRQFSVDTQRTPGDLEIAYFTVCRRLDRMVAEGVFPFDESDLEDDEAPRAGDGVVVFDADLRIRFISPNARSTLVLLGFDGDLHGRTFDDIGLRAPKIAEGVATATAATDEIERGSATIARFRCLPLMADRQLTGGLVLVRDISNVRQRDRLLVRKDATIAEIHHRVKNNLQTVSSLLRLQGRRLAEPAAKQAIDESVRRIQSIAVVHEILSHEPADTTSFAEILTTLVRLVEEGLIDPVHPVDFRIEGDAGRLRSEQSTQLAIVLNELMQNAVEHAFDAPGLGRGSVVIELANDGESVRVSVIDDGVGTAHVPPPSSPAAQASTGLGMTLVETLVGSELRGTVEYRRAGGPPDRPGTRVDVVFPV